MILALIQLFYLTNACITKCLSYNQTCRCQTCFTGYSLDLNGTYCCLDSHANNCSRCNQNNTCSECRPSTVGQNYGINSSQKCEICNKFLPGCQFCKNYLDGCITCHSNWVANASHLNICNPCYSYIPYCYTCSSTTSCRSCNTTTRFLYDQTKCALCTDYITLCIKCKNPFTCYQCINNSYAIKTFQSPSSSYFNG